MFQIADGVIYSKDLAKHASIITSLVSCTDPDARHVFHIPSRSREDRIPGRFHMPSYLAMIGKCVKTVLTRWSFPSLVILDQTPGT